SLLPFLFPTYIFKALLGACCNKALSTKASYNTTSARPKASTPFRVINSGSPGPAPTSVRRGSIPSLMQVPLFLCMRLEFDKTARLRHNKLRQRPQSAHFL